MEQNKILMLLSRTKIARGMDAHDLENFLSLSQVHLRYYGKGEAIFDEGEQPHKLYLLLEGAVRIVKSTSEGREIFLGEIREPGAMFGEVYLFIARHAYDMRVYTLKHTELLEVESALLTHNHASEGHLQEILRQNLLEDFAAKAYAMNNLLKVLASGSLRGKICRYLLFQPRQDNHIRLYISRETLANYLACSRPALSRELSALQREGTLAVKGRDIQILDEKKMERWL